MEECENKISSQRNFLNSLGLLSNGDLKILKQQEQPKSRYSKRAKKANRKYTDMEAISFVDGITRQSSDRTSISKKINKEQSSGDGIMKAENILVPTNNQAPLKKKIKAMKKSDKTEIVVHHHANDIINENGGSMAIGSVNLLTAICDKLKNAARMKRINEKLIASAGNNQAAMIVKPTGAIKKVPTAKKNISKKQRNKKQAVGFSPENLISMIEQQHGNQTDPSRDIEILPIADVPIIKSQKSRLFIKMDKSRKIWLEKSKNYPIPQQFQADFQRKFLSSFSLSNIFVEDPANEPLDLSMRSANRGNN